MQPEKETSKTYPSPLSFVPVTLTSKPTVDRYMRAYGEGSCQHSFTSLFTLREKYGSMICERDGFLFILRKGLCRNGERVYLAPIGDEDLKGAYDAILNDAAAHQCRAVFNTLTENQTAFLKEAFPGRFCYTELRDYAEYIYLTEHLIRMKGKKLADKRNKINKILRSYGERLEVRHLGAGDSEEVLRFEEKWFRDNSTNRDKDALEQEMRTIRLQMEHFDLLGLNGIGVRMDGEMIAFAYGVPLNNSCFDGLIAKADCTVIPNLYKYLYWQISCICAAPYPYFNWEEDVGVKGLRGIKTEYGPAVLMRKYLVRENDAPYDFSDPAEISVVSAIDYSMDDPLIPSGIGTLEKTAFRESGR